MAEHTTSAATPGFGNPLEGLSDADLAKFELTGELPSQAPPPSSADQSADAAPAQPAAQADSTESSSEAAPAAAAPEKRHDAPKAKKDAKTRAAELHAEAEAEEQAVQEALARRKRARELRRELEQDEQGPKAAGTRGDAATPPPDEKPTWKKYREMPNAPKSRDFDDLDDYAAAMGVFVAEKIAEERSNAVYDARSSADRDAHVRVRQWETEASEGLQRATAELERDPEIMARIDPRLQALKPLHEVPAGQATAAHYIKEQVLRRAEHPLAVLAALCADDSAELRRIGQLRPEAMIYELAKLDARSGASDPQADTAAATPPRKSMAPAPAPTLGTKPAAAKDPRKPPSSYDEFDAWNLAETKAEPSRYGR